MIVSMEFRRSEKRCRMRLMTIVRIETVEDGETRVTQRESAAFADAIAYAIRDSSIYQPGCVAADIVIEMDIMQLLNEDATPCVPKHLLNALLDAAAAISNHVNGDASRTQTFR